MNIKEREKEVIRLYTQELETCTKIAVKLKLERKSVYRILERNKVSLRPPEKKKCSICSKEILVEKNKNRSRCNTCNTNIRRYRVKKKAVDYKGGKCEKCNWCGNISGFDFHHSNPKEKDFEINGRVIASMKWDDIKKELDKCTLLCAICHRIEHSQYNNELFLKEAEKP